MSLKSTLAVFSSGFVVYGIVAAVAGSGRPHAITGSAHSVLAAWIDPVAAARADSGSRLKAEYLLGDDGSKDYQIGFVPWQYTPNNFNLYARPAARYFDSMRSEECAFTIAGDGATRCVPTDTGILYSDTGFLDAACTQRAVNVVPAPPGCTLVVPKYVLIYDSSSPQTCSSGNGYYPAHFYPMGNFVGPNQSCYQLVSGVCQLSGCPIVGGGGGSSGYATYAVGAEVPAASFVASTPAHDP